MKIEDEVLERLRDLPEEKKLEALRFITELSNGSMRRANVSPAASTLEELAKAERAMQWIAEHRNEYVGQWVALDGDRLLAAGPSARIVALWVSVREST